MAAAAAGAVDRYCLAGGLSSITRWWMPCRSRASGASGESPLWAELLSAKDGDAEVLMRYGKSNGWLDGQPAAITRKVGKGRITYIGAWLDPKTMEGCKVDDGNQRGEVGAGDGAGRAWMCIRDTVRRERCISWLISRKHRRR